MRRFELHRDEDVSGVSGIGVVAEGVAFSNGGPVALRWTSDWPTSVVFHDRGVESLEAVHGHNGRTRIVWLDEAPNPGPRCRYCGADCSDGRSWDGGDLYACPPCAEFRARRNVELIAERCHALPDGWWCPMNQGHEGPCDPRPLAPLRAALLEVRNFGCFDPVDDDPCECCLHAASLVDDILRKFE